MLTAGYTDDDQTGIRGKEMTGMEFSHTFFSNELCLEAGSGKIQ